MVEQIYLDRQVAVTNANSFIDAARRLNLNSFIRSVIDASTTALTSIVVADGTASLPSVTNDGDLNTGIYFPAADTIGFTTGGTNRARISSSGILTDSITELTSAANVTIGKAVIYKNTASAINATATATAAQVKTGLITSTSAAAVTITLPTGTLLGAALGAAQGTVFDLVVDNTAGANTVTLAVGANCIQSAWSVYQDVGGATLDVVSGVTGIGVFRFVFSSATACTFCRIA